MSDQGRHSGSAGGRRRRRSTVAAVVAATCAVIGVGTLAYAHADDGGGPQPPSAAGASGPSTRSGQQPGGMTPRVLGPVMSRSVPVRVAIPSVKIDTSLLRLGLNRDGTLQVPWKPLLAGWYRGSPTPGEPGPAIIAGHVDSWETGPAVFYRLGEVAVGDRVLVTRADATVAHFVITSVRSYPKSAFPTATVYGDVNRAALRLITCANWNSTTQEYDGNIVVFGRLVRT
jgi:sortase (surface protein transpeptidase)